MIFTVNQTCAWQLTTEMRNETDGQEGKKKEEKKQSVSISVILVLKLIARFLNH